LRRQSNPAHSLFVGSAGDESHQLRYGSRPSTIGPINLGTKQTGAPSAGNPHAGCDVAGAGNGFTVWLLRHSQRKRGATARLNLRITAPVLDPTSRKYERCPPTPALTTPGASAWCRRLDEAGTRWGHSRTLRRLPILIRLLVNESFWMSALACQQLKSHSPVRDSRLYVKVARCAFLRINRFGRPGLTEVRLEIDTFGYFDLMAGSKPCCLNIGF
jgi:hypothetical protein